MRTNLAAICGALGLVTLAVAAPAMPLENPESCALSATTVFMTVSEVSTVTVHDAPTSYVTIDMNDVTIEVTEPVTTVTVRATSTSTSTVTVDLTTPSSLGAAAVFTPQFDETGLIETVKVTITYVQPPATTSGDLTFIAVNGTTFWLNGQTPASTEELVVQTSVVTVMPMITPAIKQETTSFTTRHTTITNTNQHTATRTLPLDMLPVSNSSSSQVMMASSVGIPFASTRSAWAGWNASSTAASVAVGTGAAPSVITLGTGVVPSTVVIGTGIVAAFTTVGGPNGQTSLITDESTFELHHETSTTYSLTSHAAQSGFNALSGPSVTTTEAFKPFNTNTAAGIYTNTTRAGSSTASMDIISTSSVPCNTSTAAGILTSSMAVSVPVSALYNTSTAAGVWSTSVIGSSTASFRAPETTSLSLISSSTAPYGNLSSSTAPCTESSIDQAPTPLPFLSSSSLDQSTSAILGTVSGTTRTNTSEWWTSTAMSGITPSTSIATQITASLTPSAEYTSTLDASSIASFFPTATLSATINSSVVSGASSLTGSSIASTVTSSSLDSYTSESSTVTSLASEVSSMSSSSIVSTMAPSTVVSSASISSTLIPSTMITFTTSSSTSDGLTTTSVTSPMPSASCSGPTKNSEIGDFVLNFDDIPPLSLGNQSVTTVDPQPVFSPYHHFDFSNGFVVVPPPTDPYPPSSKPLLTEFIPNFNVTMSTPQTGPNSAEFGWAGDIGNADHGASGCFSFNVHGMSLGCDTKDVNNACTFHFNGYRFDPVTDSTLSVAYEESTIPVCPSLVDCALTPINLDDTFTNLDQLRITVVSGGEPKIWWMDDLRMGWTDNSCEKSLCRQNSRRRAFNGLAAP